MVVSTIPWDESGDYIRSGHRSSDDFEKDSFRTITISAEEGIKAVIGKPKGKDTTEVQSYLFAKDKGWTLEKAKAWFEKHKENVKVKEHIQAILPFKVLEKIVDKPLKIRGVAMTAGMSRNFNIYTAEELQAFASKLVSAPVYIEHVAVPNAVGKVTKTEWDGENLWYEAEIYDEDTAEKIRKGLVQHVSVGADYEAIDVVDGKLPHGLHNAELSLVAVPGIPETNVQILESLQRAKEQLEICVFCGKNPVEFWLGCCSGCFEKLPIAESKRQELLEKRKKMREQQGVEPLIAGEYFLGYVQDPNLFLPEHFRTVWLDQPNGILAVMAKTRADPTRELCQAVLFLKSKWQPNTVQDWLTIHPDYLSPASVSASQSTPRGIENMNEEDLKKLVEEQVKKALKEQQTQGQPKTDEQRAMAHFNITPEDWAKLSDTEKQDYISKLPPDQAEALRKELSEAKAKLKETEDKLVEAQKMIEQLKPADSLVKDPPKTMPMEETVKILEELLPSPAVERSSMTMQRECQEIRSKIFKLKERLKSG